ncbi:MAG: phospholipase D family protein [Neisseriaceae bacterium]|nr:phospholipase D family protein [Neisseriaceae bacterium]
MSYIILFIIVFILASLLSVYGYGVFAKQVKGEPSEVLPIDEQALTTLDKALRPLMAAHPDQSGLVMLQDNLDAFAVRAISAREAGRSLDLQYYIWHDDLTGKLLGQELLAAADRGVRVRLLLDDITTHNRSSMLSALTRHPNISIRIFNPTRARDTGFRRGLELALRVLSANRRMHNKAWIADNQVAIVGGRNIGDEYFDASPHMNFFDMDLLIGGKAVADASAIFDEYWNSDAVIPLSALVKAPADALVKLRAEVAKKASEIEALPYVQELRETPSVRALFQGQAPVYWTEQVRVVSDPVGKAKGEDRDRWLLGTLLSEWSQARQDVKIISPYFVPSQVGVGMFEQLTSRQVAVSVLTNSLAATDVLAVHGGYAPYRLPLLAQGVKLFELKPFAERPRKNLFGSSGASLHTKAFVVDHQVGFIGSFNFDPRSAIWNTEMGVIFTEPTIVELLEQEFAKLSSASASYAVTAPEGKLRWQDAGEGKEAKEWDKEPESRWWQRWTATVISWLPIESQL